MDVREKLIKLQMQAKIGWTKGEFADYLIQNGVTVQECKLGDKKTNADRIRSMSDEELAMCLYDIGYDGGCGSLEGTLEWLQQPAEEG